MVPGPSFSEDSSARQWVIHTLYFEKLGLEGIESTFSELLNTGIIEISLKYLHREKCIGKRRSACVAFLCVKTSSHGCFKMRHSQNHKTSLETLCNEIDNVGKLTTVPCIEHIQGNLP